MSSNITNLRVPSTGVTQLSTLDKGESAKRTRLESVIADGLQKFTSVAQALLTIRDERLYRDEYSSFADYCRERWGMSKTHANRLIASGETVKNISSVGPVPASESAIRPLTLLGPLEQKQAWARGVEQVEDPSSLTANQVTRLIRGTENKTRSDKGQPRKPGRPSLDLLPRQMIINEIESWKLKHEKTLKKMGAHSVLASILELIAKL